MSVRDKLVNVSCWMAYVFVCGFGATLCVIAVLPCTIFVAGTFMIDHADKLLTKEYGA